MTAIDPILAAARRLLARHEGTGLVPADELRVFLAELAAALERRDPPSELQSLGQLAKLDVRGPHASRHVDTEPRERGNP